MLSNHSPGRAAAHKRRSVRLVNRSLAFVATLAFSVGPVLTTTAQLASKLAEEWITTLDSSNRVER